MEAVPELAIGTHIPVMVADTMSIIASVISCYPGFIGTPNLAVPRQWLILWEAVHTPIENFGCEIDLSVKARC